MPTLRLDDSGRTSIINAFRQVMERGKRSLVFPLVEEDFTEFGYSLLESEVSNAYQLLMDRDKMLIRSSTWNPDFRIRSDQYEYKIGVYAVTMPRDNLVVPNTHPKHKELLEWAEGQFKIHCMVLTSMDYLEDIVNACSTAGQIRRILTDEIIHFVPSFAADTFNDAERKSRIPSRLGTINQEKLAGIADILAIGSLSPDKRTGLDAYCSSRKELKLKEE